MNHDDRATDAAWTPAIELATAKEAAKRYHDMYEAALARASAAEGVFGRVSCAVHAIDGKGDNTPAEDVIARIKAIGDERDAAAAAVKGMALELKREQARRDEAMRRLAAWRNSVEYVGGSSGAHWKASGEELGALCEMTDAPFNIADADLSAGDDHTIEVLRTVLDNASDEKHARTDVSVALLRAVYALIVRLI